MINLICTDIHPGLKLNTDILVRTGIGLLIQSQKFSLFMEGKSIKNYSNVRIRRGTMIAIIRGGTLKIAERVAISKSSTVNVSVET